MRNIEVKAQITADELDAVRERALQLASEPPQSLQQRDTFFAVSRGRLKLREFGDGSGELIFYERPDQAGPKPSSYVLSPSAAPSSLLAALSGALGVRGVVVKRRQVVLAGQTRIHLDEVEDLGYFLELEVVLRSDQSDAEGEEIAEQLCSQLRLRRDAFVSEAYIDLLEGADA